LLDEQKRVELAAGKTTTETTDKYQAPVAASGPHRRDLTDAERTSDLKHLGNEKLVSPEKGAELLEHYGKAKGEEASARQSLKDLAQQIGATWDQKTQAWTMPKGKDVAIPGNGITSWVPDAVTSQKGRDFRRAYLDVLSNTIQMRSGASATEDEVKRLDRIVKGTYDSDLLGGLNKLQRTQDAQATARDAGYDPEIVDTYNQNRKGSVAKAKTDPARAPEERLE
jgi:hypothetical protein